jgi:predicted PurR-regulated permease PerM
MSDHGGRHAVPVRTILATIGLVLATMVALLLAWKLARIIGFVIVAGFFAIVLAPAVGFLERRGIRRSLSTILVFFVGISLFGLMVFAFVQPVAREVNEFANNFPQFVRDARAGRGAIGRLVQRYNVDEFIASNQERFQRALRDLGAPALDVVRSVANTVFALVTILVLSFLMLLEGPKLLQGGLGLLAPERRERVRFIAADCAKAVTGYMAGNLVISVIAGVSTFVVLSVVGVPFSGVLGLWVAFADLIPLVGATLGAIPTVAVAFLASPTKGFVILVYFILYQQFENHYLQVAIMSRTVDLNPLAVLVSVLVGVQLFGILGALLAIPVAGVVQVLLRDIYDERRRQLKEEPTVGAEEVPVSEVADEEAEEEAAEPEVTVAERAEEPVPTLVGEVRPGPPVAGELPAGDGTDRPPTASPVEEVPVPARDEAGPEPA